MGFQFISVQCKFLSETERLCILSFDEMNIDSRLCFDKSEDKMYGPHSQPQVVMAQGLCSSWKQPIFFDFDVPMTGALLKYIIEELSIVGFVIVEVVSDMGGKNSLEGLKCNL